MRSSLRVPTLAVSTLIKRVPRNKIEDRRSGLFGACFGVCACVRWFYAEEEGGEEREGGSGGRSGEGW